MLGTRAFSISLSLSLSLSLFLSLSFSHSHTHTHTLCSALHRAVQRQDFSMMSHLIKLGADPLLANTAGRTAVQLLALKV